MTTKRDMKRTMFWIALSFLVGSSAFAGCGLTLPPITIVIPDVPPTNTTPVEPTPLPAPVEPEPPIIDPPVPVFTTTIFVLDAQARPIPHARCWILPLQTRGDAGQPVDERGAATFEVHGSEVFECAARHFVAESRDLPPGTHRVHLVVDKGDPPPVVTPPAVPPVDPCAPVVDHLSCVRATAAAHDALLVTNTRESCTEFLIHLLTALGPDYGFVGKMNGEAQHTPTGFLAGFRKGLDGKDYFVTGVSHDAIKRRDGQVIDVLGNAAANEPCDPSTLPAGEKCWPPGRAQAGWNAVPPEHWRLSNPFVPSTAVPR